MAEFLYLLPALLAGVVWAIEWYGHKRHKPWSFELGIPLGTSDEILDAKLPIPIPDHWVASHQVEVIVGPRLTFTPEVDDQTPACFGVLTFTEQGQRTLVHFARRANFGPLAFSAAIFATIRLGGADLEAAALMGFVVAGAWAYTVWRQRTRLDEDYASLSSSLLRQATEQAR